MEPSVKLLYVNRGSRARGPYQFKSFGVPPLLFAGKLLILLDGIPVIDL